MSELQYYVSREEGVSVRVTDANARADQIR